jgi:hypothetical protein
MALYSKFKYNDGTPYGDSSKLPYSVEPFNAIVLSTNYVTSVINGVSVSTPVPNVYLSWTYPKGTDVAPIKGIRVVRNQEGFSETEEDGKIIFESFGTQSQECNDNSITSPLMPGKYAYYTLWILYAQTTAPSVTDIAWKLASFAYVVVPKDHGVIAPNGVQLSSSTDKLVRLLPKVYTSGTGDSLGEIDPTTDLYTFLSGVAYTQDEIATNTDLLVKTFTGQDVNPNFVSPLAQQLGLPILPSLNMLTQKKLIRQAMYLYKHKGTLAAIQEYASTLTGYPTTVSESPNLLLSQQDSSFYYGVGSWVSSGSGVTLTADTSGGPTTEAYSLDTTYVGKVVTTVTTGNISLGSNTPILNALPVAGSNALSLSFYVKAAATATGEVFIDFYDYKNTLVYTSDLGAVSATTSWVKKTFSFTVPTVDGSSNPISPIRAVISIALSTVTTYYFDLFQVWFQSDTRGTQYHPASGVEVYLAPKKVNYLKNPSFKNGTDLTISGYTGTLDYSQATTVPSIVDGSNMLKVPSANPSTFSMVSVSDVAPSGSYYTFSLYAKTSSGTMPANLSITAIDSVSGVTVASMTTPVAVTITSTWTRYFATFFTPVYASTFYMTASVVATSSSATPLVDLYFDGAQLEQGYSATDFFCGDYTIRNASWTGTSGDSVSISYPNKALKLVQLKTTLPLFLPINIPYLITTGYGSTFTLEASGISA